MNNKKYLILDFETDGLNIDTCSPTQFGALIVDGSKLEVQPNSEFYSWSKPDDIDDPNYYQKHKDTIDFHCNNYNCSPDIFLKRLQEAPEEKIVFENFVNYISRYHTKTTNQTAFSAPIFVGFNSYNFDFPILDRLCKKYKKVNKEDKQNLYSSRDSMDILKIVTLWFEPLEDINSYKMDSLRDYLGLSKAGAHDALVDIRQEAQILIKFLKLHKDLAKRITFKGCFANV